MNITKLNSPIILTGVPRSGTSLIAQVIARCNCFVGGVTPRNMYENTKIRESLIVPYFNSVGLDKDAQYPITTNNLLIPVDWKSKIETSLRNQGYKSGSWLIKDAKASLIWQIWNYTYPNAKWIIVRRRTGDIIQSCLKTAYMQAYSDPNIRALIGAKTEEEGWLWWVHQFEGKFNEMIAAGLNVKVIWPERMVHGDYQQLYETLEWLGIPWKSDILNFIDPLLWSSRQKERSK